MGWQYVDVWCGGEGVETKTATSINLATVERSDSSYRSAITELMLERYIVLIPATFF